MIRKFDHITIVVSDLDAARRFFTLLGFTEKIAVVISGPEMDNYMGVPGLEADHVTLAIDDPHSEVQLLHYRHPTAIADPNIRKLDKIGFNHICFSVDDLEADNLQPPSDGAETHGIAIDEQVALKDNLDRITTDVERRYLRAMLLRHHGHLGRTADAAGITRRTLYTKMKDFGWSRDEFRA